MKKYIIIVLLLLLTVGCSKNNNNENNNKKKEKKPEVENVVKVNLFHWSQCSHCHDEIEWLKELLERKDYIKVNYYEVTAYQELSTKVREELDVLGEGVPLTVIGTDYILGFGDSTKARLTNLIEKYHEKEYCDIVSLIINNEDTTDCYLQNT